MNHSDAIDKIVPAYVKAQAARGQAEKDGHNTHLDSRYSTLDAVWSVAKPALAANGLAVIQTPTIAGAEVVCVSRIMHTSGQWMEQTMSLPWAPGRNALQQAGAAMTYCKRYSLLALLGIGGDAIDDNDGHVGDEAPAVPASPRRSGDGDNAFLRSLSEASGHTPERIDAGHRTWHKRPVLQLPIGDRGELRDYLDTDDGKAELDRWASQ